MADNIPKLIKDAYKQVEKHYYDHIICDRGIHSTKIVLKPYSFGEPATVSQPYRRLYYNKDGHVIKKLNFDKNGRLEMKAEYGYEGSKKGKLTSSMFTTDQGIWKEEYEYNKGGKLEQYSYLNLSHQHNSERPEITTYAYDKQSRVSLKKNFDINGFLNLVTEYVYAADKSKRYAFRSVTDENGKLVITFVYEYDKGNNLSAMAGIKMPYKAYMKLSTEEQKEALRTSEFLSRYQYNENGNMISYVRTIPNGRILDMEERFLSTGDYVITHMSDYKYQKIKGKEYLISIVEYDARYLEPKLIKEYEYLDKKGEIILFK